MTGQLYSGGTLGDIIVGSIARHGDRPAMADDAVRWSYRQLGDCIARFIAVFATSA